MLTLAPQFRTDYTVWRSMDRAPKEGWPIQRVQLLMEDGSVVRDALGAIRKLGPGRLLFDGGDNRMGIVAGITDGLRLADEPDHDLSFGAKIRGVDFGDAGEVDIIAVYEDEHS